MWENHIGLEFQPNTFTKNLSMISDKRKIFINLIQEACNEVGFKVSSFSQNWIMMIESPDNIGYIFGYNFSLNLDGSAKICNDKSATYEILTHHRIQAVQHHLYTLYPEYNESSGNWQSIINLFKQYHNKIVLKPNEGTGGNGVFVASSLFELESIVHKQFKNRSSFCISPYIQIKDEYRVVILNGKPELVYKKNIPELVGNGESSILELLGKIYDTIPTKVFEHLNDNEISFNYIPSLGETIKLGWKHNLSRGASVDLNIQEALKNDLENLAVLAAQKIGVRFASVDIISSPDRELSIIEINSGVMLINFASSGPQEYEIAKSIYAKAIHFLMKLNNFV